MVFWLTITSRRSTARTWLVWRTRRWRRCLLTVHAPWPSPLCPVLSSTTWWRSECVLVVCAHTHARLQMVEAALLIPAVANHSHLEGVDCVPRPGSIIELCPLEWFVVSAVLGIPQPTPAKPVQGEDYPSTEWQYPRSSHSLAHHPLCLATYSLPSPFSSLSFFLLPCPFLPSPFSLLSMGSALKKQMDHSIPDV